MLDFGRRITAFKVGHYAIEHRRRDRSVAQFREAVAYAADVMIDAENLLDDHEPPLRAAGRIGTITAELETIRCGQRNLRTQLEPPPIFDAPASGPGAQYSRGCRQKQQARSPVASEPGQARMPQVQAKPIKTLITSLFRSTQAAATEIRAPRYLRHGRAAVFSTNAQHPTPSSSGNDAIT